MKDTQYSPSTTKVGAKYGLYTGLAFLLFFSLVYPLKLDKDIVINILELVVSLTGIYYAFREFKAYNEGYMSFGQGFGIGMLVSMISGLFSGAFFLLYFWLFPMAKSQEIQFSLDELSKQNMNDKDLEMMEKLFTNYYTQIVFSFTVFGSLFLGLILSLILGAIFNKPRPPFE